MLAQTLREWQLDGLSETALLLISELVTNAVKAFPAGSPAGCEHRPQEPIVLTVRRTGTCLLLEVWDASPAMPALQDPDLTAECGRGLYLVDALSSSWGQRPADGGKVVWCEARIPATEAARRCPA